jgi:hypothetical protein
MSADLYQYRYVATFLDDSSRLSVVQPLGSKADVPEAVKTVLTMLETQSGCKLKNVRTDCGSEYVCHAAERDRRYRVTWQAC